MVAVNWWWLCLTLPFGALFYGNVLCITIDPVGTNGNNTNSSIIHAQINSGNVEDNATLEATQDSVLSASERTRRLIPYMAFYVPIQDLPINQQYASMQTAKHIVKPSATGASGSHSVALPPQYVHLESSPVSNIGGVTRGTTSYLQSSPAAPQYQPSAGDVYHTLTYGRSTPQQQQPQYELIPSPIKHSANHKYPGQHLLSPGLPAPNGANLPGAKINPIRLKTVQHFPPLPSQTTTSQSTLPYEATSSTSVKQQHGIVYRSRTKQSKINLTPFTPSNSVPGNFVPIVYTPVNSHNKNNNGNVVITSQGTSSPDIGNSANNVVATELSGGGKYHQQQQPIPFTYPDILTQSIVQIPHQSHSIAQQQKQHPHQSHSNNAKQQEQQYFSVTPSSSLPTGSEVGANFQPHNTQGFGPPPTFNHKKEQLYLDHHNHPKIVLLDTPSESPKKQPSQVTLSGLKHEQSQQQYKTKIVNFQPSKPDSFLEYDGHPNQYLHVEQQQPRYSDKQMHPQISYHQQEQGHNQATLTKAKYRERVKQPTHIIVLSSTAAPHDATVTALAPVHSSQGPHFSSKYSQPSPIHHPTYLRPELSSVATHGQEESQSNGASSTPVLPHTEPFGEQILTIPVHNLFSDLRNYQHNHYAEASPSPISNGPLQYPKQNGPSTPHYIDYTADEPKQAIDDDPADPYKDNFHPVLKPTIGPPSHAFIVVTTAAPFHQPITQANYGSTIRPVYKSKTNVRLQPATKEKNANYPVIKQPNPTPRPTVTITSTPHTMIIDSAPKYVYVKEEFGQKLSAGSIKLKPVNKYENNKQMSSKQQPHNVPHLVSRPPSIAVGQALNRGPTEDTMAPQHQLYTPHTLSDPNELPDIRTSSLAEILHKLQESNHLPHTLTPDNIDNSIKTLIRILNNLKKTQTIEPNPPQHHENSPSFSPDYDYGTGSDEQEQGHHQIPNSNVIPSSVAGPNKHPGPSTGRPGIDYPIYSEIPQTSFDCSKQRYKGFFGDPETNCQVWHYCDLNGGKASFLCPNGTIFSQIALTCDWWFNVKCATTAQLYVLNERLYKYILPFTPKFPEDYSGPIVDKYLALKFQEMEEKMRLEKKKTLEKDSDGPELSKQTITDDNHEENHLHETTIANDLNHASAESAPQKHESINSQVSEQSSERNLLIDDEVDDISQRGSIDTYETTTAASDTSKEVPLSIRPIIVSSTVEPDYDEEEQQDDHDDIKRNDEEAITNKIEVESTKNPRDEIEKNVATITNSKPEHMKITVEKVNVIEIKPDGATGHLIREMIMQSEKK
ncbi:uncharacterized protein LOC142221450 [Haematobia irritans]|uniref:uncharacterized protein LOC142221450 n=1 Tax=Haematobia irritans TaxID=7368 RepID=UPI003F500FB4